MKPLIPPHRTAVSALKLLALAALSMISTQLSTARAQSSAFTYQGRLAADGAPYSGPAEMQFTLFVTPTNGVVAGGPVNNSVNVTNGLFTVLLDFGALAFPGGDRWLEIAVRTNGGAFAILAPRQQITTTPYSITATRAASLIGTLPAAQLSGAYSAALTFNNSNNTFVGSYVGNGSGVSNVNASTLGGLSSLNFWKTNGNAGANPANGAFLGTTDNQPLEIKVNGARALRLEPTPDDADHASIVNVLAGSRGNFIGAGVIGATIAGGGAVNYFGDPYTNRIANDLGIIDGGAFATVSGGMDNACINFGATVGGGNGNRSSGENATIAGGRDNTCSGYMATVGGGEGNECRGEHATVGGGSGNISTNRAATVGGGIGNTSSSDFATIAGGEFNAATGIYATIGGGLDNTASGQYAMVIGGHSNVASGDFSFAAGNHAKALHQGAFVWADDNGGPFASTANNQFAVRAIGGMLLAANVQIGTSSSDYRRVQIGGGNSSGVLYGSFPALGDGIHLGYNHYYDAAGGSHVLNTGGATSRISVGYGDIQLSIGIVNGAPIIQRLLANSTGVTVNGTFNNSSDRNQKQDFAPVSPLQLLEKVSQLPLSEWSYKEDPTTRHIGPVAQDFYCAFNIGTDDKHIAPMDEGGVALAAIQGLNQKLTVELKQKETEITELKQRLEKLEQLIHSKKGNER